MCGMLARHRMNGSPSQALMEMQTGGPAAMAKYANDPEILGLVAKIQVRDLYERRHETVRDW